MVGVIYINQISTIGTCLKCMTTGRVYHYETIDEEGDTASSEYLKDMSLEIINKAEQEIGCKVMCIVTDNENKMVRMKQLMQIVRPDISYSGCNAHWLNLLSKDLTPPGVVNHIIQINSFFKNHSKIAYWLSEVQGTVRPKLVSVTRWSSTAVHSKATRKTSLE